MVKSSNCRHLFVTKHDGRLKNFNCVLILLGLRIPMVCFYHKLINVCVLCGRGQIVVGNK
jgi:hypothetical protein